MVRRDPLGMWWCNAIRVKPLLGSGAYGDTFGDEYTVLGKSRFGNRLIRDATGAQVVSSSGAAFPATTTRIPLGSQVQLPSSPPEQWRTVIAEAPHVTGTGLTPDYYSIDLD